jgi:hypothetical protein
MAQFTFRRSDLQNLLNNNADVANIIISVNETIEATPDISEITETNQGGTIYGCPYPPGCN